MHTGGEITALLQKSGAGDREAFDALFVAMYAELHQLAEGQRQRWDGDYTLNTTSLVHEAYLKLVDQNRVEWSDRNHFLAVSAKVVRHILINYAERKRASKRGGGREEVPVEEANPLTEEVAEEVLTLHDALQRLEAVNERQARVVEARFFGGFTLEETGTLLDISTATVKRDWLMASAWLHREIERAQD